MIKVAEQSQKLTYADLTQKQINALSLFVNPEVDTITEIADKAGVSRQTIYSWMDNEDFKYALNEKIDKYTDSQTASVWKSLIAQARKGNVQAIKLFFEMKDQYRDRKEITGAEGGAIEIDAKTELADRISKLATEEKE